MKYLLALLLLIVFSGCDDLTPWSKSCSYELPSGYSLGQLNNNKYVILTGGGVMTFGWRYKDFQSGPPNESGTVSEFDDSCDAKGMIKYMFETRNAHSLKTTK